jgi:hypothetical protein
MSLKQYARVVYSIQVPDGGPGSNFSHMGIATFVQMSQRSLSAAVRTKRG